MYRKPPRLFAYIQHHRANCCFQSFICFGKCFYKLRASELDCSAPYTVKWEVFYLWIISFSNGSFQNSGYDCFWAVITSDKSELSQAKLLSAKGSRAELSFFSPKTDPNQALEFPKLSNLWLFSVDKIFLKIVITQGGRKEIDSPTHLPLMNHFPSHF